MTPIQSAYFAWYRITLFITRLHVAFLRAVLRFAQKGLHHPPGQKYVFSGSARPASWKTRQSEGRARACGVWLIDRLLFPREMAKAIWVEVKNFQQKRAAACIMAQPVCTWTRDQKRIVASEAIRVCDREYGCHRF